MPTKYAKHLPRIAATPQTIVIRLPYSLPEGTLNNVEGKPKEIGQNLRYTFTLTTQSALHEVPTPRPTKGLISTTRWP